MAKRFTDSQKWTKPWFRKLPPKIKLLWQYVLDNCDMSGVFDVDLELASYCIGEEITVTEAKAHLSKQIIEFNNGKWFICDFITFQYGELREECRPHKSVIETLKRHGLWKEYSKGIDTLKDKDKDKDKDIDMEKDKDNITAHQLFDYYNETVKTHNAFPSVLKFTKERADKCRARLKDVNFFETFKKALVKAKDTPFLCGTNDRGWKMNFDFLIANDSNVYKILEGKYDGAGKKDYGGQW